MTYEKIFQPPRERPGNIGITQQQPIDGAAWIWHPGEWEEREPRFLLFRREFDLESDLEEIVHLSADERYELFLDGELVSRGPDRSDISHWSYASYRIGMEAGSHVMEALVWKIGESAPVAQLSLRGGFILKGEGEADALLTTGRADWQVCPAAGWDCLPPTDPGCFGVGDSFVHRGGARLAKGEWESAVPTAEPVRDNPHGTARPDWKLYPSRLPDQTRLFMAPGRIIAAGDTPPDRQTIPEPGDYDSPDCASWNALIGNRRPLALPAGSRGYALWDLEEYVSAYPRLEVTGGADAKVTVSWAESFYLESGEEGFWNHISKGNRDETRGKFWNGMGDTLLSGPPKPEWTPTNSPIPSALTTPWWRSGRFIVISWETGKEPLTLTSLDLEESRYPLEMEGDFSSDDEPRLPEIIKICVRGMQMCAHETFMDCPYYEQLMYVGDTRLELLTLYTMTADDSLAKRCLELFDYSRVNWGFVNERYPSRLPQHSPTFSLIWTMMLRDFALWRNDRAFVKARMIGMRSMMEHFEPYLTEDGLLQNLPGWPFMDWEWDNGVPPGGREGISSSINALYVLSLKAAAQLEAWHGEELLAKRMEAKARRTSAALWGRFYDESRGLLADNLTGAREYSEHTQVMVILGRFMTPRQTDKLVDNLVAAGDLRRTTSYFSFYLFEALALHGRTDLFQKRLDEWKTMADLGCRTPLESPEPSRSDCHAWSSQPLYHLYCSVAGIKPDAPGFARVRVAPQPGLWEGFSCAMAHPKGKISVSLKEGQVKVQLPPGVRGTLVWQGRETPLGD